jgi:hypothetical protein
MGSTTLEGLLGASLVARLARASLPGLELKIGLRVARPCARDASYFSSGDPFGFADRGSSRGQMDPRPPFADEISGKCRVARGRMVNERAIVATISRRSCQEETRRVSAFPSTVNSPSASHTSLLSAPRCQASPYSVVEDLAACWCQGPVLGQS